MYPSFDPYDDTNDQAPYNPFPAMRARSIFNQPTTPEQNTKRFLSGVNPAPKVDFSQPSPPPDPTDEGSRYFDAMRRMSRAGPAVSAYQAALKEQPTAETTEPSMGRKLIGTLAGVAGGFAGGPKAGIDTAENIIDSPYKEAMRDYQARMKNLGESAKLEQDDQTSQLNAMAKAREFGLSYDKYKQQMSQDLFERGIKERTTSATETQAQAAARRAATGETEARDRARNIDSEITTRAGQLDIGRGNLRVGQQNAGTNATRAATEAAAQKDTAAYRTAREKRLGSQSKIVSPSQQAYAEDNALRELATDRNLGKYAIANPSGTYTAAPDDGTETYKLFKQRFKTLTQSSLKGTPFDNENDDTESPFVIGPPRRQ
jgi:hypothetical protein